MVEQAFIGHLKDLFYAYVHGWELSPESGERDSYRHVVLKKRFLSALRKMNPWLSGQKAGLLYKKTADVSDPDFAGKGKIFYDMLLNGVKIKERGQKSPRIAKLIDFEKAGENDFLCANQYAVENPSRADSFRRSDLVVFVNGLPLVLFEFKSFQAHETAQEAFSDHRAKMAEIPQLYAYAQLLGVSDGLETRYGTPLSDWDGFLLWEGILDEADLEVKKINEDLRSYTLKSTGREMTSYEVLLEGLFRKENLLAYLQDFVFYEKSEGTLVKKAAGFQHFYVTRKAIERTQHSILGDPEPDQDGKGGRIGVVRQDSDPEKILAMILYARKALKRRELEDPLLLFLTDRKDLKEQISRFFEEGSALTLANGLRELRTAIRKTPGGIVIVPLDSLAGGKESEGSLLSDRRNIIVIADEAQNSRCQDVARNLRREIPNASFLGFTAMPGKLESPSTAQVFGEPLGGSSAEKTGRLGMWLQSVGAAGLRDFVKTLWGGKKTSAS